MTLELGGRVQACDRRERATRSRCHNLLGSTLKNFFQHDRVEFGACDVIDSNADFLKSEFSIESSAFWVLFFDVELNALYFRKRAVALFHQPLSNTLALKLGKDI